jgi:hypothetical protein
MHRANIGTLLILLSIPPMIVPPYVQAQSHAMNREDLQKDIVAASRVREANLAKVQSFFSSDAARQALKSARVNERFVQNAVRTLDNEELAKLAARVDKSQQDFAAGVLTNQEITYIIIALATAVIILVIVAA